MAHYEPIVTSLIQRIQKEGSLSIADFMSHVLCAPDHGYYMRQDPFGQGGDFITAPEISQIFGELIAAWVADTWLKIGAPKDFILLECGPGRGTLMADMLRTLKPIAQVYEACTPTLMEISPALKHQQKRALLSHNKVRWINELSDLPADQPIILVANEFLDALPVKQFMYNEGTWEERRVSYGKERFNIINQSVNNSCAGELQQYAPKADDGDLYEYAPAVIQFVQDVRQRMKASGSGAALFIDYGHTVNQVGQTLQAVHNHKPCDVLDNIGNADLSAHVNFKLLYDLITADPDHGFCALSEQGKFLSMLGGQYRAQALAKQAKTTSQAEQIINGYNRLRDDNQMGRLFKAFAFAYGVNDALAGF